MFSKYSQGIRSNCPLPSRTNSGISLRRGSGFLLFIALAGLAISPCSGSEIKLTSGEVMKNVTVVRRDDRIIEVQTEFGKVPLPLSTVVSIDGVDPRATLVPALTPPAAKPPVVAVVSGTATGSTPVAQASPAVSGTPKPGGSVLDIIATPSPAPTAAPVVSADQVTADGTAPAAAPLPWPPYEHGWRMEIILLAFTIFSAIWIGSVGSVRRSLFERRADPRFWSNLAILLPGVGFLLYRMTRMVADAASRRKSAPTTNELVARREKTATRHRRGFEFLDEDRKAVVLKTEKEVSGIENAKDVLEEALLERASDVHIEPAEDEYGVRFRVDGIMQARMNFSKNEGTRIVSALKTLAQIDVAEKRKAQDGRFRVRTGDSDVDFRVATANSIFGEKVVIRILDRKAGVLGLGELGMPKEMMDQFERVIHSRNGMILATGPTGSGKTSTLYSALNKLDSKRLNIMTIEDPVEYELTGATQIPVNVKAGITYESGLRSLLRQDPDVIFVGEMRDAEAAQIALRAALTGHLVFSSLHTRDAIGTVVRLEEMGIERHLLASSLLVLLAQRLVRVLCPECRESYACVGNELAEIGIELEAGSTIYRAKGCKKCGDAGYVGRTGIFEMVVFEEELRQAVNSGAGEAEMNRIAHEHGYRSFREMGGEKILQGITSVEEVLQAS